MNGDGAVGYRDWAAADLRTRGVDAIVVGAAAGVPKTTWLLPGPRERGVAILRGCPADRLHASRPYRVVPPGTSPAGRALTAVGLAKAGQPALVYVGTGGAAYGELLAALHLVVEHTLPVQFVVTWYEGDGPFAAPANPAQIADALGLSTARVDGRDEGAVRDAVAAGTSLVLAVLHGRA